MKESIYIETSVVSYYTSKPSRDLIVLSHQQITWEWWPKAIKKFKVYISEVVIEEARLGNPEFVKRRLRELKNFPHLELIDEVERVSHIYI